MVNAVHALLYAKDAGKARAFLRDVLGWPHVDQALAVCLKHPNVFMETSAIHPFFWPESFIKFMNSILQDKVVFATDWNLLQIDDTIVETEKLIASQQIAEKVFRDNWKKILGPDIV